jgi:long-subunit fatty acid transport protein
LQLKSRRAPLKLLRNGDGPGFGRLQHRSPVMISKISVFPVALVALGLSKLASASNYDEGQWVTTFMAGTELLPTDSISPHVRSHVGDLGVATLDSLQVKDAFRSGPSFGVETGYMSQSNLEPFVRLSYSQLEGRNTSIGSVAAPELDTVASIGANFDDMKSWALNLGTRYFLSDTRTVRTYVAGYLGADRMDAMRANLNIAGVPVSQEEFLPRATRFDAGVEGGLSWALSDQADLGLSVGAQYVDARKEMTNAFAPIGLDQVRFEDPRWSIPVNLAVNFRF